MYLVPASAGDITQRQSIHISSRVLPVIVIEIVPVIDGENLPGLLGKKFCPLCPVMAIVSLQYRFEDI
jgi:hypothetical protein